MSSELFLSRSAGRLWTALREQGRTVELRVERLDEVSGLGRIVKGRVTNILPGMQSAFVDIGAEQGAFLHARELTLPGECGARAPIQHRLREGRELLVQVEREERGAKGARVSCDITLPGRLLVLLPMSSHRAVSRRIHADDQRERLRGILEGLPGERTGWVARTAAESAGEEQLHAEAERLLASWQGAHARIDRVSAPATVLREPDLLVEVLRDAPAADLERIVLDDAEDRQRAIDFLLPIDPRTAAKLRLHSGPASVFEAEGLASEIEKALRRRVWLKSGGYLVIEATEALVSIDVNTGKYVGKQDPEQTILRTNLEAAREIPRQLRLRGLGGIVVIDLIDMRDARSRQAVLAAFAEQIAHDPARTRVAGLSELGLLELTRKWTRPGLADLLTRPCPTCRGDGQVRSD